MSIDPRAGIPLRLQLAALIRGKILAGELGPGDATPSGPELADTYHVSRYTADRALDQLAAEGLVQRISGIGTIVLDAATGSERVVRAPPGSYVRARMPSGAERAELSLPPGVPVIALDTPGEPRPALYAADRTVIHVPGTSRALPGETGH